MPFRRLDVTESPTDFHARPFGAADGGRVWVPVLDERRTLVLGSSQPDADADARALAIAGVGLTRRRSGGGAVLVARPDLVWFDVVISSTHPCWTDDVVTSFDWIGAACARGLATLGLETRMHRGRLRHSPWSRLVCFAGLGPGELTDGQGRKLVGMSQRRTRDAARFQVAILRRWDSAELASLLALDPADRARCAEELADVATGIHHDPDEVLAAVVDALPS